MSDKSPGSSGMGLGLLGLLVGSVIGFLMRPSAMLIGQLPFETIEYADDTRTVHFTVDDAAWRCFGRVPQNAAAEQDNDGVAAIQCSERAHRI